MLDEQKMQRFEKYGAAAALKLRGDLADAMKEQIGTTMQAITAYFDDRKARQQAISDRIETLKGQLEKLQETVADVGPRLAAATISGDSVTLETIQEQLTNLEARKAATAAQVELLSRVSVAGDEKLFAEADGKARALDVFLLEAKSDLSALAAFAVEQAELWRQVSDLTTLGADILPHGSIVSRVEKMREDFDDER
mgnify:CR=1 FL=1